MTAAVDANLYDNVPNRDAILSWYLGLQRRVLTQRELAPLRAILDLDPRRLTDFGYMWNGQILAMSRVAESLSAELLVFRSRHFVPIKSTQTATFTPGLRNQMLESQH